LTKKDLLFGSGGAVVAAAAAWHGGE